jgi:hypothetical protein
MNSKFVSFTLISLAFLFSLILTLSLGVLGTDIWFHLKIAEAWSIGDISKAFHTAVSVNGIPYPPLLHFILVPLIWLNQVNFGVMALQVLFYTLSIALCMRYAKVSNSYIVNLSALFLLSSVAFFDRAMQVQPQALDFLLLPILMFASYKRQYPLVSILTILLFLNHGYVAGFLSLGAWLYLLYDEPLENVFYTYITFCLTFVTVFFILVAFQSFPSGLISASDTLLSAVHNSQQQQFLANPIGFTMIYQGIIALGIPFAVYNLLSWRRIHLFDKLNLFVLIGLLPMAFFWGDRFLQYSTIPLSMILASNLYKVRDYFKYWRWGFLFTVLYILLAFIFFIATFGIMSGVK